MTVRIKVRAGGPFAVEGPIRLVDAEGNPIDIGERKVVLLCRCGASRSRPFCDGAHYRIGFESPPPCAEEGEEPT
jgi:CDGSH-type Zn-finger protein